MRNFAERDLRLSSNSSSPGSIGLRVIRLIVGFLLQTHIGKSDGQVQGFSNALNIFFVMRSSKE